MSDISKSIANDQISITVENDDISASIANDDISVSIANDDISASIANDQITFSVESNPLFNLAIGASVDSATPGSILDIDVSGNLGEIFPSANKVLCSDGVEWLADTPDNCNLVDKTTTQTISGQKTFSSQILATGGIDVNNIPFLIEEITTPANPASSHWKLYAKADGFYQLDDLGNETALFGGDHDAVTLSGSLDYLTLSGQEITLNSIDTDDLINGAASPGNSKYFGTDSGGTKGFFDLPAGGGLAIGDAISGGTANRILFEDGSNHLAEGDLYYDGTNLGIGVSPSFDLDVNGDVNAIGDYKLGGDTIFNVDGTDNLRVGVNAATNATGSGIVAVGANTQPNSTGNANITIGANVGNLLSSGRSNIAIGSGIADLLDTGIQNAVIGVNCCQSLTSGDFNVVIGNNCAEQITTQTLNVVLGRSSLKKALSSTNIVIGAFAIEDYAGTQGSAIAIGFQALKSATNIRRCIATGEDAGKFNAGLNTILSGYRAGYTNSGSNSIIIGDFSGYFNSLNNSLYIDSSTTSTHTGVTNPLLYGQMSQSSNPFLRINRNASDTNSIANVLKIAHQTTGTPAAGYGAGILFELESTTTEQRQSGRIACGTVAAADASRKYFIEINPFDTAERKGIRVEANGSAPMIGFLGAAAIARPAAYTQTYATATRTHAARTAASLTDNTGGTANTTVAAVSGSGDDATINDNFADLAVMINNLIADNQNTAQVVNQLLDDLQTTSGYGLLQ